MKKGPGSIFARPRHERGVALLIVLLVTALLIALVFEFAYATRISMNSAVNYRDSQRAYFLARTGITAFLKAGDQIRDGLLQGQSFPLSRVLALENAEVMIKWEDEQGKIAVPTVTDGSAAYKLLQQLFFILEIDQDILDNKVVEEKNFQIMSQLHRVLNDEDYRKVEPYVTPYAPANSKINVNTASLEVLRSLCRSLGKDESVVSMIDGKRKTGPYTSSGEISDTPGMDATLASYLDFKSSVFKVYAYSTVGGYTKQVEAVISGGKVTYWRAL